MYWLKLVLMCLIVLVFVLKVVVLLWWRPRKIEQHFSKQGIKGPPYHFFIGNVKEIVGLMMKASSQPMPFSHNILPRVLSFYHHWKKIYGTSSFSFSFFFFFSMVFFSLKKKKKKRTGFRICEMIEFFCLFLIQFKNSLGCHISSLTHIFHESFEVFQSPLFL